MPKRKLDDFLAGYLDFTTKNSESPVSYHTWSGMGLISSALERKCSMDWGHTTIYPNQYIILIGPSGRARKGEPIAIAASFMKDIGIQTISESITREALIRRMKDSEKPFSDGKGMMRNQSPITIVAEEIAVFLGENNVRLLADMTNWYDSRDKWTYETKGSGTDSIPGVCANVLGSMAPDWIPLTLPQGAIGGGFTSRIIFVVEHRKGRTIPDPSLIGIDKELRKKLLYDLQVISQMKGLFSFSKEARAAYVDWYKEEERKADQGKVAIDDPRFSGYNSRRATHIKKIGMALSASRGGDFVIQKPDFDRALAMLKLVESNMIEVFGRIGRSLYSEQTYEIMKFIQSRKEVMRSEVLRTFYRDVDHSVMQGIEDTLHTMRVIQIERDSRGHDSKYIWSG